MLASHPTFSTAAKKFTVVGLWAVGGLVCIVFAGAVVYAAINNVLAAVLLIGLGGAQIADTIRLRGNREWERNRRNTWWL